MTLTGLSLAYLRDRALNTGLNILLLTLGVATMAILVLFSAQLGDRFQRDAQGADLVVGAKGKPLQLILSSIYQVDVPTGNIPLETLERLRRDPTAGAAEVETVRKELETARETAITNVRANLLSRFAIKVDGDPAVMLASAPAADGKPAKGADRTGSGDAR